MSEVRPQFATPARYAFPSYPTNPARPEERSYSPSTPTSSTSTREPATVDGVELRIDVIGTPAPQGSKRAYVRGGRAMLVESSDKVRPWRQDVSAAAVDAAREQGWAAPDGPVSVTVLFWLPRPKSAPKRRIYPDRKPDLDKLLRSTLDALTTAQVIEDDARVQRIFAQKAYAPAGQWIGAQITLRPVVPVAACTPTEGENQ